MTRNSMTGSTNSSSPPKPRTFHPISCDGERAWACWKCCWAAPPRSPICTISKTWWRRSPKKPACEASSARRSSGFRWRMPKRPPIRFRNDPLVVPAVAPHAIYTNSDETLKAARALANKYSAPLIIHISETKKENDDELAKRHMTPVKALESLGVFNGRTVAAHCVWVNDADMAILKTRGVGVAHCPSSNMKLASGVAPVVRMRALGINVGLGPDGPAGSNNDFNLFEEMDLAAKLQKVSTLNPQALPASAVLEMATIGGARVLGLEKLIGSLENGKRADMIMVRLDRPNAVPLYDPISQMVYALKAEDVRDVMVNGKPVVRDGQVLTLDEKQILQKADEYRAKVSASLK